MIVSGKHFSILAIALGFAFDYFPPARAQEVGSAKLPTAPESAEKQVTFNRDIAPIVLRICAKCHRPGEAGPFSLLTYADAKSHARQMAKVTRSRFMPPWLPEPTI